MIINETVTKCKHGCKFFWISMDGMECNHPYFKDKPAYENMIISENHNSYSGNIPDKCPLRHESLTINYKLGEDK